MKPGIVRSRMMRGLLVFLALLAHLPAWAQIMVTPAAGRQPDAFVGESYGPLQIRISGGLAPYSLQGSTVALPLGMTIDFDETSSTVTIAGEPTQAGDGFRVDLLITDANNDTLQTGGFHIHSMPSRSLFFTPESLPPVGMGQSVEVSFIAQKGQAPYRFQAMGALPAGLTLDAGGRLSGRPQQPGPFAFQVRLTDANGSERVQDYVLQVDGQPPVAGPVSFGVPSNAAATQVPLATSGDVDAIEVVQAPPHGAAEVRSGALFYTPAADFVGVDRFQYLARNAHGASAPAPITVQVIGLVELPLADDVALTVAADSTEVQMPLAIRGPQPTSVSVVGAPTQGQVQVRGLDIFYSPLPGFTGIDSFQYRAHRGSGASPAATVTITVVDGLAAPEIKGGHVTLPSGSADVLLPLTLAGGAADRLVIVAPPEHGNARVDGLRLMYTAAAGFTGQDALQVVAENGAGQSAVAVVTVDVVAASSQEYLLDIAQGGSAALSLSSPTLRVVQAVAGELSPANAGAVTIVGDQLHVQAATSFHGKAQAVLRLIDADGAAHDGLLKLSVAAQAPLLDASLGELLRTQQFQAHDVAALRTSQVSARQAQLAGQGEGWGTWLDATVGDWRWIPRGDEHRVRGQSFGLDRRAGAFHVGAGLSNAASRAPLSVGGSSKLDAHGLTLYAGTQMSDYYLAAQLGAALLDYDARRMQFGVPVRSDRQGQQWHVSVSAGRSFTPGHWQASVALQLDAQHSRLQALSERLPDGVQVTADSQRSWAIEPALRAGLQRSMYLGNLRVTPRWEAALSARWMHLQGANASVQHGQWLLPVVTGESHRQSGWSQRLGVDVQVMPSWLLQLGYHFGGHEGGQTERYWGLQVQMDH